MGSSSGGATSSWSSVLQNSGSGSDEELLIDERKRKRMKSNRESARRSRLRKQKYLDDLTSQVSRLERENQEIITSISIATHYYLSFDGENAIMRAQVAELSQRLQSMNEVVEFLNSSNNNGGGGGGGGDSGASIYSTTPPICEVANSLLNPLMNLPCLNQHVMASTTNMYYEYY